MKPVSGCGAPIVDRRCSSCSRPAALDLYSGAGDAGVGYHRAGFCVTGVDIAPQPRYPFTFYRADALEFLRAWGHLFALVHTSPPCQHWSDLAHRNGNAAGHPQLIDPTRELLEQLDAPWVIENVETAPLRDPVVLCGTQFSGLRVLRHRKFETSPGVVIEALPHGRHPLVFTHDKRKAHYGKLDQATAFVQVTGGGNCTVANKANAMGIDWMTGHELNEAIPPAYTEHVGHAVLSAVRSVEDAA